MKKIQLSDGMPNSISKNELTPATNELLERIEELCKESELSYVEINKALYLADKELYTQLLQAIVGSKEQNKEAKTRDYLSLSEKHRSN
ncbi:hypothetical protein ABQD97_06150 [Enterococcus avium]|jgi:hypothetical protein|uniref:hypothetical protein n=1 Tax=Enterococcus avium TaxID=33945 RepID=UPI0020656338|nr:hypothetical protein [Enterococcus avium]MDT2399192.1 hypothetical protein [Enterococcus avium]DAJ62175.1 MAG TPA: hypothetical protein [Caudoviricetes sp.]